MKSYYFLELFFLQEHLHFDAEKKTWDCNVLTY